METQTQMRTIQNMSKEYLMWLQVEKSFANLNTNAGLFFVFLVLELR